MKLIYRDHESSGISKRVWRENWSSDCFEILTMTQFLVLKGMCKMFNIILEEAED